MSHQEKAILRKEVDHCVPKSAEELLGLDQLNEGQDVIQYSQAENPLILVSMQVIIITHWAKNGKMVQ